MLKLFFFLLVNCFLLFQLVQVLLELLHLLCTLLEQGHIVIDFLANFLLFFCMHLVLFLKLFDHGFCILELLSLGFMTFAVNRLGRFLKVRIA